MVKPPVQQLFQQAVRFHRAGRLQEAEGLCRQILGRQPHHGNAMHMLGTLALQKGKHDVAADLIGRAIAHIPPNAHAYCNLATALENMGKVDEAIDAYRQALKVEPQSLQAHINLGILLAKTGQADQAIAAFQHTVAIDPNFMYGHYNLGNVLRGKGELDAAIAAYRRAIALKGDFANAHFSLGNALGSKGLLEESITALRRALALDPGLRAAYVSLGLALRMVGRIDEAVAVYQQAIAVHPDAVECYCGLGDALIKKGLLQEAADVYRQAIAHDSNSAAAHRGLAGALEIQGDIPALIEALKAARAVAADPANHDFELAAFGVGDTPPAPPHSHIVSLFNEFAESFDRQLQKLQYIAPQLLFDAVRGLHPQLPMDIIDLGCGTGMCGELFRPMARKLVGVDLAPKMIEKSRQRGVYEELKEQDITVALQESPGQFDLIVAADLFIYIGYLDKVFQAAATALRPGGLLAFSIESADSGDYVLRRSRRYAQSADYIRRLASQFRFKEASIAGAILRTEGDLPVEGKIIVLQSANCSS